MVRIIASAMADLGGLESTRMCWVMPATCNLVAERKGKRLIIRAAELVVSDDALCRLPLLAFLHLFQAPMAASADAGAVPGAWSSS